MVHLSVLKTFVDAAKNLSFRAAAEKNFITQPAVSQHVRQLEETLGCALFERRSKKVFLTAAGETFLAYAEKILKIYEEARTQTGRSLREVRGTIRIAAIYSIGLYKIQPVVRRCLSRYPQIDIHLEYHPSERIYEMVFNGLVDFGLVAYPRPRAGVNMTVFSEEEMVLVQSPHHPIFKQKIQGMGGLENARFIAFAAGTPTRAEIDRLLRSHGAQPKIVHEYDNVTTLKSAVELGMGCAIVPRYCILQELKYKSLALVPSVKIHLSRPLGILYPKGKVFTRAAGIFYKMLTGQAGPVMS